MSSDSTDPHIELYSYYRSSCSWRVRILLNLKNLAYKYNAVHLVKGEQHEPSYLSLNPMHEVPTLKIDNYILSQSRSIIDYIEERYPENSIYPQGNTFDILYKRSKVRALADIITSDTQPVQNLRVMFKARELPNERQEWAKYWIENGLNGLEAELSKTSGKYCVGDEITLVDICIVPQVYNARRFNVDMTKYPIITRIDADLSLLPQFIAAHPKAQPDCPEAER